MKSPALPAMACGRTSHVFEVFDKMTWWQATSVAAPAATVLPGDRVLIAWRGNQNSRNLTVAVVVPPAGEPELLSNSSVTETVLSDSSDYAPALAFYDSQAWLAWTGTNGACTVNVANLLIDGQNGVTVGARAFVNDGVLDQGAASGPTLSPNLYIDELSLHAVTMAGDMADSGSSPAGAPWSTNAYPFAQRAKGPMSVIPDGRDDFIYAWTDAGGQLVVTLNAASTPLTYRSAQMSNFAPALAVFNNDFYIAWTGTDGHLNVGQVVPGTNIDPIVDVRTFDEQSLAGPILIVRSGQTQRLTALWTGVDGTGAINAGVVNFV
jgi:hypothetical protein